MELLYWYKLCGNYSPDAHVIIYYLKLIFVWVTENGGERLWIQEYLSVPQGIIKW